MKTRALAQDWLLTLVHRYGLALAGKDEVEQVARTVDGDDVVFDGTAVRCAAGVGLPLPLLRRSGCILIVCDGVGQLKTRTKVKKVRRRECCRFDRVSAQNQANDEWTVAYCADALTPLSLPERKGRTLELDGV